MTNPPALAAAIRRGRARTVPTGEPMTDPTTEPRVADNPAAWALAQHIADHPMSTIQAAFRYLNAPLEVELTEAPPASAVSLPPADQAELRDRIAEALHTQMSGCAHDEHGADCVALADAVLAVLPATTDQTAALSETERRMLGYALDQAQLRMWATGKYTAEEQAALVSLRRMADETQPAETEATPVEHAPGKAIRCPACRAKGYTVCRDEPAVTVHACPGPDDNGFSPCCKRPPFEFRGERLTRDPDKVTCTGPAAGARQDGAQR